MSDTLHVTKDDAIAAVRESLRGTGLHAGEDDVIEKAWGWLVCHRHRSAEPVGGGPMGTIVERHTGRLIRLGSGYDTETHVHIYEAGYYAAGDFDLVITAVADPIEAVGLLASLRIQYVVPEVAHGRVWRVPTAYTEERLAEMIRDLPCRLHLGELHRRWQGLERLVQSKSLELVLEANAGFSNGP